MTKSFRQHLESQKGFPSEEFDFLHDDLTFHGISIIELLNEYDTPLRITYLPEISKQIQRAKSMFAHGQQLVDYKGKYHYCYCTKSSHFKFVLDEVLKNDVHLETSSAFDIDIILNLAAAGKFSKDKHVIFNGFKNDLYLNNIARMYNEGFRNAIPVLDSLREIEHLEQSVPYPINIGLRVATEESPSMSFNTSRLGIRNDDIIPFYKQRLKGHEKFSVKMVHFFVNTGIQDNSYYWDQLEKLAKVYCNLKKECPSLDSINIGGGLPVKSGLSFDFDYDSVIDKIVATIAEVCREYNVPDPDIFTEFGSYTVGESQAIFYSVLEEKKQNEFEDWYMIDSSFMTTLPDTWSIKKKFIVLPINRWDAPGKQVVLGGITCDGDDYYGPDQHKKLIYLPELDADEKLYVGFFHTGAYQESIGGYGGIQHCLTPSPKHIIIQREDDGKLTKTLFADEQEAPSMLRLLGYGG